MRRFDTLFVWLYQRMRCPVQRRVPNGRNACVRKRWHSGPHADYTGHRWH